MVKKFSVQIRRVLADHASKSNGYNKFDYGAHCESRKIGGPLKKLAVLACIELAELVV
jgi:hypothetical protein